MEDGLATERKKKRRIPKWIIMIAIFIAVLILMIIFFENSLRPAILALSEVQFKVLATKRMNESIINLISGITYTDLINITYDKDGRIAMLQANTIAMSRLSLQMANNAQESISDIEMQGISIPLGNVLGGQLLSGMGPKITVNVISSGIVKADFADEFESSGINQTRHRIYIVLTATVQMMVAGGPPQKVEVTVQVPISETIIIGSIPQSYLLFDGKEKMYNLLPN